MAEQAGTTLTRHDLEAKIVERCWEDEAFRKEFTADPAGAFFRYLEVPKDSLPKIVVHEEGAGSWHIVVPAKPANVAELSEADLEKINGASPNCYVIIGNSAFMEMVFVGAAGSVGVVSKVVSGVSAVVASGIGSLIAGQNIDTGW
jgi:hypothetical protein